MPARIDALKYLILLAIVSCGGGDTTPPLDRTSEDPARASDGAPPSETEESSAPFASAGCALSETPTSGLRTTDAGRTYYLRIPRTYESRRALPLLVGLHGTDGSHASFLNDGVYDLESTVGEEAVMVYPDAELSASGIRQWDLETDLDAFRMLLDTLEAEVCFDRGRVFVVGHSSGAGMTHAIGCHVGERVRAIGLNAGALVDRGCEGQVAVIQVQGERDEIGPLSIATPARDYWVARNGCDHESTTPGAVSPCVAYEGCDPDYPVHWCQHPDGHPWPSFASDAIWGFFEALDSVAPGPGSPRAETSADNPENLRFSLTFPEPLVGTPEVISAALYPPGTTQPIFVAPNYFLNTEIPVGAYAAGATVSYAVVAEVSRIPLPGTFTLAVIVYMEGGQYPIPTSGVDYLALVEVDIGADGRIELDAPLVLEPVQSYEEGDL
jgi:poly(3-hydroxybutyrate) depolymerase